MISKPGIYTMSESEYHADPCATPSLSSSIAKVILEKSPAHARLLHPRLNPDFKQQADEDYFDLGTAAHSLLLEGVDKIEVIDADNWRTNKAKAERDEARANGKIPMLPPVAAQVRAMRDAALAAIAANKDLAGVDLSDGKAGEALIWQREGVWCRSLLDWLANRRDLIIDYKTTAHSAAPLKCSQHIEKLGYDVQSAFYICGLKALDTAAKPKFVYLFQETEPPYLCSFIGMSPSWLELGEDKVRKAVDIWDRCMRSGKWPGYGDRILWPDMPPWVLGRWNDYLLAES